MIKNYDELASFKILYHATFTKNIPHILKEGLTHFKKSNWQNKSGDRLGNGDIYAFTDEISAIRWGARMDWAKNEKMGTGDISVIRFRADMKDWTPDNDKIDVHNGVKTYKQVAPDQIVGHFKIGIKEIKQSIL